MEVFRALEGEDDAAQDGEKEGGGHDDDEFLSAE